MSPITVLSHHPDETMKLGASFAQHLKGGEILCLWGDLGTGKTTFIKGIACGLKIDPAKVQSPTFVLMNAYEGRLPLFHFDFYRIEHEKEILALGFEEYFYGQGVTVVEWAQKLGSLLPREYLRLELSHKTENERLIQISALGKHYADLIHRNFQSEF